MFLMMAKTTLFMLLAIPAPLVGWCYAVLYLHGSLEKLWLAPFLLVGCLSCPCLGFAVVHAGIRIKRFSMYISSYFILLMSFMFLVIIFKRHILSAAGFIN